MAYVARGHPFQVSHDPPGHDQLFTVDHQIYDVDDRTTPDAEFSCFHKQYRFTIDAAASHHNARLPRYWTIADDGLSQSWEGERVWCNPPFSNIEPWVVKAWNSDADLVVMLLPANRTEQTWWQRHVEPFRDRSTLSVNFLPGRMRFLMPGSTRSVGRPPFGCCLLIWACG